MTNGDLAGGIVYHITEFYHLLTDMTLSTLGLLQSLAFSCIVYLLIKHRISLVFYIAFTMVTSIYIIEYNYFLLSIHPMQPL